MARMERITATVREFLATGPLAHVVTLDPDGTPHVSMAWVGADGDELVFSTFPDQHKLANLRRDPRVTLSFQANEWDRTTPGLHPYLVIRGTARVTEGGALPVMDRLAEVYMGPGRQFWWREAPPGYVIHVAVERLYGIGPWREADAAR